jgi:hypothetical protein
MLLTKQKQDLLKRLKSGHMRSVVNDVQVRKQQFLWWCNSDGMPHLLRHNFTRIAAYYILISAFMYRRCMRTGAWKSLDHSARGADLMCVLIVWTFLSGIFERWRVPRKISTFLAVWSLKRNNKWRQCKSKSRRYLPAVLPVLQSSRSWESHYWQI